MCLQEGLLSALDEPCPAHGPARRGAILPDLQATYPACMHKRQGRSNEVRVACAAEPKLFQRV